MDTVKNRMSGGRFARAFAVSALVSGAMLAGSAIMAPANATNMWGFEPMHKVQVFKKHLHKASFAAGVSAMYARSNLLPKTDHYVRPVIATNAIYGNGGFVCGPSGMGHRSTCGVSF